MASQISQWDPLTSEGDQYPSGTGPLKKRRILSLCMVASADQQLGDGSGEVDIMEEVVVAVVVKE